MSALFTPFQLRDVRFKNRVAVSPMSQYRALDGAANDWHKIHLGRFAMGGAGLVYTEATAVTPDGRRTHGDLGLWTHAQTAPLAAIAAFLSAQGAVPGIQLSHAGRKASERRPWHGETPVDGKDLAQRGEAPWPAIAPSAIAYAENWPVPAEMNQSDIMCVIDAFASAAKRSQAAGFKIIEVYAAHGFLIHQFLSPIANRRKDQWGGSARNRMRFAVEVAHAIRNHWPDGYPLAYRLSMTDWVDGGLEIDDTLAIAKALKAAGVDMIDCSSGGIGGRDRPKRMSLAQGFQVPFAQQVKSQTQLAAMAVGMLWDAHHCNTVIEAQQADMVALARELLDDPNWPLHAEYALTPSDEHKAWPIEFGWWLMKRARLITKLKLR